MAILTILEFPGPRLRTIAKPVDVVDDALQLTCLQLPGGKALNFSDLYNSRREQFAVGTVLA